MTADIGQQARNSLAPTVERRPATRLRRLLTGVTAFGVVAFLGALVLVALDIALRNSHLAVYAAACFVLAGLASTLLVLKAMLAECQAFYRRGHLDGWVKGWNGQNPESGDPLLK